ncbi:MAG: prolipoprotein diacylglyceryl transferase [Phycisphaerales bacterium]|nr:MAG: prolipoprotein diacylglyceryl transferase [Phycisphaerales bacterium]
MLTLGGWLHTLDPFLWRISGDLGVRWYGMAYIAGFVVAWITLWALAKRGRILIRPEQVTDLIFAIVLGVLLGGRLGYVLIYQPSLLWTFEASPPWWGVLAIHKGGMASHGGMIGVAVACIWYARRVNVPALHLMDMLALVAPVGVFFGRLANFVNGELLGKIVAAPGEKAPDWSVRFPQELRDPDLRLLLYTDDQHDALAFALERVALPGDNHAVAIERLIREVQRGSAEAAASIEPLLTARHPSQLYQAFAEGVVVLVVLCAVWMKPRRPGVVSAWFLMTYGAGRIFTELYRLPDAHLRVPRPMGLTYGQWLSVAMITIGALLLAWIIANKGKTQPIGGWRARNTPPPGTDPGTDPVADPGD